jgi:PelA/Pel-15E family pectate lyase
MPLRDSILNRLLAMNRVLAIGLILATVFSFATIGWGAIAVDGRAIVWQPITVTFDGPEVSETDSSPNPFLDIRLQVIFASPDGRQFDVPGFFDGDGKGGPRGRAWRVRFAADAPGTWRYEARFRKGSGVAVDLSPEAGEPLPLPDLTRTMEVAPRDSEAPGFLKWGRLEYAGKHYLKFRDGSYWIRGGTDEPENLLGYAGFDHTPPHHRYKDHEADWRPGDPDWGNGRGRGIIGALNYLARQHVNSIYFLTMNVGGDGKDVWPWSGQIDPRGNADNDNLHFDVGKLRQWGTVFDHAQRHGIFLHFVFNEAEAENKRELDDGELGPERKLFYREMIARFGHHVALEWNLCEEYNLNFNFGPERIRAFADYIRAVDPYDHPITVHSAGDPVEQLRFTFGDPRFSMTSIQLNQRPIHEVTQAIRSATRDAGRPLPVSLDEFTLDRGQRASHIPVDDADGHRREKLWPTYFSGGMIEFILGDLLRTDSFKTPEREKLWQYTWYARRFMEEHLPFWEMQPADALSEGGGTIPLGIGKGRTIPLGPRVFAKLDECYAVYLPIATPSGTLDLTDLRGAAQQRWYNPRTGEFEGEPKAAMSGSRHALGAPPSTPELDWVVLVRKNADHAASKPVIDLSGFRDGAHHWRHIRDDSRVIQALPDQPAYEPSQVDEIVDNILLFQRSNGGWPKDYDMTARLTDDQRAKLRETRELSDTSFDNHNIHTEVDYLARAYAAKSDPTRGNACLRGFDFMLAAQLPNGGFPQRYPNPKGYSAHVTFNDGVMIGVLNVLKDAADGFPHWQWLDVQRRQQAQRAVERGIDCILKCRIRVDGRAAGWCQQHDPKTFEAAPARMFELASICPQETTEIMRFLMRLDAPSREIIGTVDDAAAWLAKVQLADTRIHRVSAPVEEFQRHRADFDVVVTSEPGAPPIWARHYEIGTDRPVFAGRDAVKRYALSEIERERRTGTPWYGQWPRAMIDNEYPQWRRKIARAAPTGN